MRALQARGTGIETRILHHFTTIRVALVAQMVERKTLNLVVVGSIPTGGALLPFALRGFGIESRSGPPRGPPPLTSPAALAQLGERQTEDLKVPGSIPGGGIFC